MAPRLFRRIIPAILLQQSHFLMPDDLWPLLKFPTYRHLTLYAFFSLATFHNNRIHCTEDRLLSWSTHRSLEFFSCMFYCANVDFKTHNRSFYKKRSWTASGCKREPRWLAYVYSYNGDGNWNRSAVRLAGQRLQTSRFRWSAPLDLPLDRGRFCNGVIFDNDRCHCFIFYDFCSPDTRGALHLDLWCFHHQVNHMVPVYRMGVLRTTVWTFVLRLSILA